MKNTMNISMVWYHCLHAIVPTILPIIAFASSVPMSIHFVISFRLISQIMIEFLEKTGNIHTQVKKH